MASRRDQTKPKQFDKILRLAINKLDLIKFLIKEWSSHTAYCQLPDNKELYVTCEEKAFCITSTQGKLSKLSSQQEEADTKMFLSAAYAVHLGFDTVRIVTVDTDVAILTLYYQTRLDLSIYLEIGTGSKVK